MGTIFGILSAVGAISTLALWFQRIRAVAIPVDRTAWGVAAMTSAALGVIALANDPGWIGGVPAGLGVFAGLFFSVLIAISGQQTEGAIGVGDTVPDVSADDDTGTTVALSSFRGGPALYKFFRGHW